MLFQADKKVKLKTTYRENSIIVNIVTLTENLNFSSNKTVLCIEIFLWDVLPMYYQEKHKQKAKGGKHLQRAFSKAKEERLLRRTLHP